MLSRGVGWFYTCTVALKPTVDLTIYTSFVRSSQSTAELTPQTGAISFLSPQVPIAEKQWLISPPPSPPVGWAPIREDPPVYNESLVEALMGLDPRRPRELRRVYSSYILCVRACVVIAAISSHRMLRLKILLGVRAQPIARKG